MEIIHLILGKANPERMNGINRVVYQLASHQHKHGRNVRVWGITRDLTRNFKDRSFSTELFPASRNPFGVSAALREAIASMQGRRDVVFHLHGGWVPVYGTLSGLLKQHGLPYVLTGHGAYNTVAMQRSRWKKRIYYRLFEKRVLDRAGQVHSIGRSEMDGLQRFYPNQKSTLLPYGFESGSANAAVVSVKSGLMPQGGETGFASTAMSPVESELMLQRSESGSASAAVVPVESGLMPHQSESAITPPETASPEPGFVIGFVGRLDTWTKGLDLLIRSFQEFRRQRTDARLWILGDGPGRSWLDSFITENNIEGVELWGSRFGEEKDDIMSRMHVFVHPSRNEGLPASVLEAAAMGIPVIVSEQTNVSEAVGRFDAGVALPENTSDELTRAFAQMYEADVQRRRQLGENARRMVAEVFRWSNLMDGYDAMYRSALR
jgi:glycosyltransferase involved in cell wall biosynthesis